MSPLVSVVMPVYNAEPLLAGCLDALVAQTFRDFELICINDGSTDGSPSILDDYARRHPFIQVVHQANIGQYPTRNVAFDHVRGRYVMSVDCDDRVAPCFVEKAFYRAEAEQADVTLVGWDYLSGRFAPPDVARWNLTDWAARAREQKFPMAYGYMWMKMYRTAFLEAHRLRFREDFYCKADVIFHWKSMSLAERVAVVPEVLYHYRVHENSVTGTIGRRYIQVIGVVEAIKADLEAMDDPKGLLPAWYPFALGFLRSVYRQMAVEDRGEMEDALRAFLQRLTPAEQGLYREPGTLGRDTRYFYLALESRRARLRYATLPRLRSTVTGALREALLPRPLRRGFIRFLRRRVYVLGRSAAPELRRSVAELNRQVHELAAENYRLRSEQAERAGASGD